MNFIMNNNDTNDSTNHTHHPLKTTMAPVPCTTIALVVLLGLSSMHCVEAFTARPVIKWSSPLSTTAPASKSTLNMAFSVPALDFISRPRTSSGSFDSGWYTDVKYPTPRTPVYNDAPLEYTFTPIGSDWPSMDDATQQGAAPVAVGMWRSAKNAFRSGPSMIYRYLTTTRTIQDRTMGL